jgi:hypothetical protein
MFIGFLEGLLLCLVHKFSDSYLLAAWWFSLKNQCTPFSAKYIFLAIAYGKGESQSLAVISWFLLDRTSNKYWFFHPTTIFSGSKIYIPYFFLNIQICQISQPLSSLTNIKKSRKYPLA